MTSTRPRNRSGRSERTALVGRLQELATTRHVLTSVPQVWWQRPHLAGRALIKNPQMTVLGQLGRGMSYVRPGRVAKAALARWLYVDEMRRTRRPVVVFDAHRGFEVLDEVSGCEPLDMSGSVGKRSTRSRSSTHSRARRA